MLRLLLFPVLHHGLGYLAVTLLGLLGLATLLRLLAVDEGEPLHLCSNLLMMLGARPKKAGDLPLVSVVIPTYNRGDLLREALDSVCAQTYSRLEIIVVDDGSTDHTRDVVRSYGDRLVYLQKRNGGLSSARNAGMRCARGRYMALMDSDDLCEPERIALQVAFMERHPDMVLCSTDFSAYDGVAIRERSHIGSYYGAFRAGSGGAGGIYPETGRLVPDDVPWLRAAGLQPVTVYHGRIYEQLAWGNFIHPPTVVVRRELCTAIGEFDERMPFVADYDWCLRASRLGPMGYIDAPLLKYRYSPDQMSSDRNTARIAQGNIAILHRIRASDPKFVRRNRARFRRRLGLLHQSAANALGETQRLKALVDLARSLRLGVVDARSLRILAKVLTPRFLLEWRRRGLVADGH